MGVELPDLERQDFAERLQSASPVSLSGEALNRLFIHYSELRRWNRRLSLVGPTDGANIFERHYGESLAAVPLLSSAARVLVDVGSGAGFPGLVLAIVRPDMEVTLVEARERKWAFLMAVRRQAALSCRCLNVRVGPAVFEGLPSQIDVVTSRAVRAEDLGLEHFLQRLTPGGAILLWSGRTPPELPAGARLLRERPLAGSQARRILEIGRVTVDEQGP